MQLVDVMLYEPSGETEDKKEGNNNDPKDGDISMKKKKISASATSINNFLNMDKQDIANSKQFEYEFINSGHINKIRWEMLGDTEYITDNNLVDLTDYNGPEPLKEIDWSNMK